MRLLASGWQIAANDLQTESALTEQNGPEYDLRTLHDAS
jgi:hypothetical protein